MLIGSIGRMAGYKDKSVVPHGQDWQLTRSDPVVLSTPTNSMLVVCFTAVVVCTGVGSLVLEHLHQTVEDDG
jgi:hypothetical protein